MDNDEIYPQQVPQEEGGISWGKMLLGGAVVTGLAVLGVGLYGDKMAEWVGAETSVGKALTSGHDKIAEIGSSLKGMISSPANAADAPAQATPPSGASTPKER